MSSPQPLSSEAIYAELANQRYGAQTAPAPEPAQPAPAPEPVAEPSVIDAIAEDAAPPKWPADAPTLWPYLKLPFRARAAFFTKYTELRKAQTVVDELKVTRGEFGTAVSTELAGRIFEAYAVMDELLEIAAVDKRDYRAWVMDHSDEDFTALYAAYMARSQPGEASSSAG
jgi:hypothetical protein